MAQVGGEGKWSGFEMGDRVARGFSSSEDFEMKICFLFIYHTFTSMSLFMKFSPPGIPCLLYSYFSNLLLFKTHLFQRLLQLFLEHTDLFLFSLNCVSLSLGEFHPALSYLIPYMVPPE